MTPTPFRKPQSGRPRDGGSALIIGLVLLLIMTLLGVTALRGTVLQERMSGNMRDRDIAFQAAEAALREAETFLEQAALPAFGAGNPGLIARQQILTRSSEFWNDFNWAANARTAAGLTGPEADPRYVIEELPSVAAVGDSVRFGPLPDVGMFRVTTRATGGTQDAVVILQSTYRR